MPELPTHLAIGRNNPPGPRTGGYQIMSGGPITLDNSNSTTVPWGFIAPFELRVERVQVVNANTVGPDVNTSGQFHKHASAFTVAGSVNLVDTNANGDADGDTFDLDTILPGSGGSAYADGTGAGALGTLTLTAAGQATRRNAIRGDRLFFALTEDATGGVINFYMDIIFTILGHVHADPRFD